MAALQTVERYWETLRWLRPVQFYGRAWFRLSRPRVNASPAPLRRVPSSVFAQPARRTPSLTGPGAFTLLNESGDLAANGWDDPKRDKLWRYNQHYFDDLNAIDAASRQTWHQALLSDWVTRCPPGLGTAWEPYPTSLRIVNWVKWALAGNALDQALKNSLAAQTRWLAKRLEWHLLGNHLFANAKALIFAGLWFDSDEARAWRDQGFEILASQTDEQILPDGGQFELSPMYHALALEDVLDLVNVTRAFSEGLTNAQNALAARWSALVPPIRHWLAALSHPDGDIAFFNDAAFAIAASLSELDRYARDLGFERPPPLDRLTWLADSGYARLTSADATLIVDMARVGPNYLPGHAHADTLSFELSVLGQRVFVNSGTSVYGTGPERQRQRGTPAHNTVTVSGQNSSDVWAGFRVGARARPFAIKIGREDEVLTAQASHDGYRRLRNNPVHTRSWRLSSKHLRIDDRVSATETPAEARFHLHPDVMVCSSNCGAGTLVLTGGAAIRWNADGGPVRIEPSTWHPEFGMSVENVCLVVPLSEGQARLELSWD